MKLLDNQGRLWGKFSLLDLGGLLVMLLVVFAIFFMPGSSGRPIIAVGQTALKSIEVDVLVLGLGTSNPKELMKSGEKTNFIIRNQRYGEVDVEKVKYLARTVTVSQPDGSVKALPDPRPEMAFSNNLLITLKGKGQLGENGPVLGNSNVKIGTPVEMEGDSYDFKGSVIEVRVEG